MAITAEQIAALRADIGDTGTPPSFSDEALETIWERVSGARNAAMQHEAALGLMLRQLMGNAAKFADFTSGLTSEKRSQVFEHLKYLYELYKTALDAALSDRKQVAIASLRGKPNQRREYPDGTSELSNEREEPQW